jgi:hypothetical protein
MKLTVLALLLVLGPAPARAQTAMSRVVGLITELKAKTEADGKEQQQS